MFEMLNFKKTVLRFTESVEKAPTPRKSEKNTWAILSPSPDWKPISLAWKKP